MNGNSSIFGFLSDIGNYDSRKVGTYRDGDLFVNTAAVSDGRKPFETAVGHPEYNNDNLVIVECYDTREEAERGHDKWVIEMTGPTLPDTLKDCCNAAISQLIDTIGGELTFPRVRA